jgi:predicted acetyltransferase
VTVQIRVPTEDDTAALFLADGRNFAIDYSPEEIAKRRPTLEFDRFRIAVDGGEIVGIAGTYGFEMTVPGGATLPTGGLTWVSVSVTHRRQGVMRRLLDACHADVVSRGEPLAALGASEGTIYERFGYGVSCETRVATVDRRTARLRPEFVAAPGSVRYVNDDEARQLLPKLWDRYRRSRPCEFTRVESVWDDMFHVRSQPEGGLTRVRYLVHRDGYLSFRRNQDWTDGFAANRVEVRDFVAVTQEAMCALWTTLLGLDLVGPIKVHDLPLDSPLPYLLENPRSVHTTRLRDSVWLKVIDPEVCFAARTYGDDDRLVIETDGVRYAIEADRTHSTCRKVRSKPDLVVKAHGVGPLLMGGVRPSVLAAGGVIEAKPAALRRADRFFLGDVLPHCQTGF